MQKSELIYEAPSSFDKIASDCPDHSRTDIDSPAFKTYNENIKYPEVFPCLKEYKHLIYKEKLNNPIYNSKGYSSENEENDYCFANDNDNNENTTEEKNLQFNSSESERENINKQKLLESLENISEISKNISKDNSDSCVEKIYKILNKRIKNKKNGINNNKNKYITQKKHRRPKIMKNNIIFKTKKAPLKKDEFYNKLRRTENLRQTCFYTPMEFLKKYLNVEYGLNFGPINCKVILGKSIGYMKEPLELKVYQLLCFGCKNKEALDSLKKIEMDESKKFDENKKFILFFLLTRTYEELYNRYIDERFNFSFYYKDKKDEKHITITNFITLQKAIDEEIKRLKKNKEEETYIKRRIRNYSYLSIHMIKDIKAGKYVKQAKKEQSMKNPKKIEQLENWVKIFNKEKVVQDMS